jgi:hypothetical protein
MVKIIHIAEDGSEGSAIVLDDFTVEVIYSGIAAMLRDAATTNRSDAETGEIPREALQRQDKILARIRS